MIITVLRYAILAATALSFVVAAVLGADANHRFMAAFLGLWSAAYFLAVSSLIWSHDRVAEGWIQPVLSAGIFALVGGWPIMAWLIHHFKYDPSRRITTPRNVV